MAPSFASIKERISGKVQGVLDKLNELSLNLPISSSATGLEEFTVVEPPPPDLDVRTAESLPYEPWGKTPEWDEAAALTTEWEGIARETLATTTHEPTPCKPPMESRMYTEEEKFDLNKGTLYLVARRANYWFEGMEFIINERFGTKRTTQEYITWCQKAYHDVRHVMDKVGKDENGDRDSKQVAEFYKSLAQMLLEKETIAAEENRERGIDMEQYQQCIATGLEEAGFHLNMDELFILKDIEGMRMKLRQAALKSKTTVER